MKPLMPGYTHTQHAQPTTLSHNLLAHANAFLRDIERIKEAFRHTNQNPLGAAAFASTGFPINRKRTTELLGFDSAIENSMDAVSTRDFMIESISCFSNMMTNLSRMAEELILWSSSEFGFIELDDSYSSTSSIMPQKKNPDIAELMRAKAGTVTWRTYVCTDDMQSSSLQLQSRPSGSNTTPVARRLIRCGLRFEWPRGMIGTMNVKKNAMITATNIRFYDSYRACRCHCPDYWYSFSDCTPYCRCNCKNRFDSNSFNA